jgi:hypothetical protein
MKPQSATANPVVYYRLIALWVLCEAMLGGIIHGFKIPVSGLVVGSCAVVCICLIAWYAPVKGAIIKATVIVAIFKMMLSPQAPPPAYIAVFFQGLLGELLFRKKRFYPAMCVLLGVLSLLESGLQRPLIMTLVYGNDLWKAINDFLNNLTGQKETTDYSYFIITWYLILHLVVGLMVGLWAGVLPRRIRFLSRLQKKYSIATGQNTEMTLPDIKRKKRRGIILFIIWIALILLYAQSYYGPGKPLLPSHISLRIFIRSVIIILAWFFIVGPLLKQVLHKWLQKKKTQSRQDVQQVLQLLPATQQLVYKSWQLAGVRKGWKRVMLCITIILANIFYSADG